MSEAGEYASSSSVAQILNGPTVASPTKQMLEHRHSLHHGPISTLMRAGNWYAVMVMDIMKKMKAVRKADADTNIDSLEEEIFPHWGYPDNGKL